MNEQAIKKLRWKFIKISMLTLILVMLSMSGLIYIVNTSIAVRNISDTTYHIIKNNGIIQDAKVIYSLDDNIDYTASDNEKDEHHSYDIMDFFQEIVGSNGDDFESSKYGFATRYFAVIFDEDLNMSEIITNHMNGITKKYAKSMGEAALYSSFDFGNHDNYYYQRASMSDGKQIVVYLESTITIQQNNRLLFSALSLVSIGVLITFFFVRIFSSRAIAPEIRNAELQKRFITDASHELKTPLAVIKANTEMGEILNGENEWTQSTLRQVDRMSGLIKNLVTISRGQESEKAERTNMDISAVVKETAETFLPVAQCDGKEFKTEIDDNIHLVANDSEIRQLASLLIDNAIKYCDDKGTITVALNQKGKRVILKVSNSYQDGANVDYSKFFQRFYREDESHNIDKGGYGIGLSIAENLVQSYKGTINVCWDNGTISFICTLK